MSVSAGTHDNHAEPGRVAISNLELDEQIEIAGGRRAPFTQLADWVALSGITDHAKALYWHLKMHVNVERGDFEVWPTKDVLAGWMRLSREDKINPYLAELVAIGAVNVYRRRLGNGLRDRNRYVIHDLPPEGYSGPSSLAEWYARQKTVRNETAGRPVPPSTGVPGPRKTTQKPKTAGRPVPPSTGVRTPVEGRLDPPSTGVELDEEKQDQKSSSSAGVDAAAVEADRQSRDDDDRQAIDNPEALTLVEALPCPPELRPTAKQRTALAKLVIVAMAAGWPAAALTARLSAVLGPEGRNPYALWRKALSELPEPPAARVVRVVEPNPECQDCGRPIVNGSAPDGLCRDCRPVEPVLTCYWCEDPNHLGYRPDEDDPSGWVLCDHSDPTDVG